MPESCSHPNCWGRILIVAAHPDDEVLALGGHFRTVHPRIFHLTTGAGFLPIPRLAQRRAGELKRALSIGRIPSRRLTTGVVADQGVVQAIPELVQRLKAVTDRVGADCLLTHAYEGGHPDHDAASIICRLAGSGGLPVYEFTGYHNGTPTLPRASLQTNKFLASDCPEVTVPLSDRQQRLKRRMLRCFRSQAGFLNQFPVAEERFRRAPQYQYGEPPHRGTLLYESFGWPVDYPAWRAGVEAAATKMGVALDG